MRTAGLIHSLQRGNNMKNEQLYLRSSGSKKLDWRVDIFRIYESERPLGPKLGAEIYGSSQI